MISSFHKVRCDKSLSWGRQERKGERETGRNLAALHWHTSAPPQRSLSVVNKALMRDHWHRNTESGEVSVPSSILYMQGNTVYRKVVQKGHTHTFSHSVRMRCTFFTAAHTEENIIIHTQTIVTFFILEIIIYYIFDKSQKWVWSTSKYFIFCSDLRKIFFLCDKWANESQMLVL